MRNGSPGSGRKKTALILSGGGARGAYQVGVLKALADILPKRSPIPFPIICGTSAGGINAAALAIYAPQFREAVSRMVHVWGNFRVGEVFRADARGLAHGGLHWLLALTLGGLGKHNPTALLDRAPLVKLLNHYLPFERIQESIDHGFIQAVSISASSYTTGNSVAFFQGAPNIEDWHRPNRRGARTLIGVDHLLASSAIPFVFGAERIGSEYFGDGSMRQTAPVSPALHLGADRLFVIGVKRSNGVLPAPDAVPQYPSLAEIAGHVLDSIFLDNVEMDLDRLQRINEAFSTIPIQHHPDEKSSVRPVAMLSISPSRDPLEIAKEYAHLMPRAVRILLRGVGVSGARGSNLLSYLLFEKAYCRELINMGYGDTMQRREDIVEFLELNKPVSPLRRVNVA